MKTLARFFTNILIVVCGSILIKAQDVIIDVQAMNIFNRAELITPKRVMNTGSNNNWRITGSSKTPTIKSISTNHFTLENSLSTNLPTSVLQWQLLSIGTDRPVNHGSTPGYKYFTTAAQSWFEPAVHTGQDYTPGIILFNFKIPASEYLNNAFYAGVYSINITHNYIPGGPYQIHFTPYEFKVKLAIPAAISWLTNTPTKYIEISSLSDYRSTAEHILGDLVPAELGNTVDFNLWAKASAPSIDFTSSKGVSGSRNISAIQLGSTGPGTVLPKKALSATAQNYSSSNFVVKPGNRNNFTPQLSISAADFKQHFFEAGTYSFQLNFNAQSTVGTNPQISSLQNTDVTLKVLPLSEITIPTSGQTVNFDFKTSAAYSQGLSKVMSNQIKLSNNETFELYVKSDENYFKNGGIQTDIKSNILQIGVDGSSLNIPLSTTPKKIFQSGNPVLDQELNIKYTIPSSGAQNLIGKEKTTYSINVIYSFTAI